jgi:hypothetical protein
MSIAALAARLFKAKPLILLALSFHNLIEFKSPARGAEKCGGAAPGIFGQRHGLAEARFELAYKQLTYVLALDHQPAAKGGIDVVVPAQERLGEGPSPMSWALAPPRSRSADNSSRSVVNIDSLRPT